MTQPLNPTTLRLSYSSEDELDRKLILTLTRRGYSVTKAAPERITVPELASRVGRSVCTLSRSLRRPSCPEFECARGKRRILWLVPNDKLISFLTTPTGGRPVKERL